MTFADTIKSLGCTAFARKLQFKGIPFVPYPYQEELFSYDITDPACKIAVQKSRQVGLSMAASILILFSAITNPFSNFVIVAPTKRQAGIVFEYIRDAIRFNSELDIFLDSDETRRKFLVFKNGSTIQHETASYDGDNLRGIHIGSGCLIFDELAFIPDQATEILIPLTHSAATLAISTPKLPTGYFHRCCTDDRLGYKVIKVNAWNCPHITDTKIAEWKRTFSQGRWLNEVVGEFAQGSNNVFSATDIEDAIDTSLPLFTPSKRFKGDRRKSYVYSLDVSQIGNDAWSLMIGDISRSNHLRVVAYHNWLGTQHMDSNHNASFTDCPDDITAAIVRYTQSFPCTKLYVDVTNNNYYAYSLLNHYLLPVDECHWSQAAKEQYIEHLAACFRAGRISIPDDDELRRQLLGYSYNTAKMVDNTSKNTYMSSGFDDQVCSLAMLCQSVTSDEAIEFFDFCEVV